MVEEDVCGCFTCANAEDERSKKAYEMGCFETYRDVLYMLRQCGITNGRLTDPEDTLSHLYAVVKCEMDDSKSCLMSEKYQTIKFKGYLAEELEKEYDGQV